MKKRADLCGENETKAFDHRTTVTCVIACRVLVAVVGFSLYRAVHDGAAAGALAHGLDSSGCGLDGPERAMADSIAGVRVCIDALVVGLAG